MDVGCFEIRTPCRTPELVQLPDGDQARRRVIAAISEWVDKLGYTFDSREAKVRYVIKIACRAANCGNFNAIPESRLSAIYNLYCKRNEVDITGNPELDFPILAN